LLGFQWVEWRVLIFGPPANAAFRETFQAKPVSLAIVNKEFERRAGTITEDEKSARERVLIEACFAEGDERINPLAKVDGLVGE
jgi:hypothetical protein